MSSPPRGLTTTSYAILGLLAIRPWSTYELATQMRRNLHYLLEGGFATAASEPVGRRRRTVYAITQKGRRALERWITEPAGESRLESETLVKLMFATHGSKSDVLAHLQRLRSELETKQRELQTIFGEYLAGADPFPERVHVNVLCYRLIWDLTATAAAWTLWAVDEVERWPGVAEPPNRRQLMKVLEAAAAAT